MFSKFNPLFWMCAFTIAAVVGCGAGSDGSLAVSGKVTVKGGGPVTQGSVQFQSEKSSGSAPINAQGQYTMPAGGVPAGKYKVAIVSTSTGGGYDKPDEPEKRVIHSKYEDSTTSGLEVTVGSGGSKSFDFELDAPEAK